MIHVTNDATIAAGTSKERPTSRCGKAWLTVIGGPRTGCIEAVAGWHTKVGRGRAVDVVIADEKVSRHHASVLLDVDGLGKLVDENSTNGVRVNGQSIASQGLLEGDFIELGDRIALDFSYDYGRSFTGPLSVELEAKVADAIARQLAACGAEARIDGFPSLASIAQAIEERVKRFPSTHVSATFALSNLGVLLERLGEPDAAVLLQQRASRVYANYVGPGADWLRRIADLRCASALIELGDTDGAEELINMATRLSLYAQPEVEEELRARLRGDLAAHG